MFTQQVNNNNNNNNYDDDDMLLEVKGQDVLRMFRAWRDSRMGCRDGGGH